MAQTEKTLLTELTNQLYQNKDTTTQALDFLMRHHFGTQRSLCKGRIDAVGNPIEFRLTYNEWLGIWLKSGKLHLRGRYTGKYVMSRINDIGHYEPGNVDIVSWGDNIRQSRKKK